MVDQSSRQIAEPLLTNSHLAKNPASHLTKAHLTTMVNSAMRPGQKGGEKRFGWAKVPAFQPSSHPKILARGISLPTTNHLSRANRFVFRVVSVFRGFLCLQFIWFCRPARYPSHRSLLFVLFVIAQFGSAHRLKTNPVQSRYFHPRPFLMKSIEATSHEQLTLKTRFLSIKPIQG